VVASFQWQLTCLAVITGGALALSGGYAVRLLLYGARARNLDDAIGGVAFGATLAALLGGILLHQYRRRTRPTLFLIDDTSFAVDPEDERYMWIGVPRGQVAGVEAIRLRGRAFARRPGALKVHLHGAPPLVALSGSDLAVVERVAAELRSVLSATGAAPTPVAPLNSATTSPPPPSDHKALVADVARHPGA
jgi:hypothetical protein